VPLYDVLSTISFELADSAGQPMRADTHLGQRVGGQANHTERAPPGNYS
jgi:serine/threonine-protein kinase HipA